MINVYMGCKLFPVPPRSFPCTTSGMRDQSLITSKIDQYLGVGLFFFLKRNHLIIIMFIRLSSATDVFVRWQIRIY